MLDEIRMDNHLSAVGTLMPISFETVVMLSICEVLAASAIMNLMNFCSSPILVKSLTSRSI